MYNFSKNTIKFFKYYLSNRTQIVKGGDLVSSSRTVFTGVPQGLIIGPILYLIYINDIHMKLTMSSSLKMYADDLTLHSSGFKVNEIKNALQENIDIVEKWFNMNNMKLNPNKSKCMLIGTSKTLKQQSYSNICINETILENVDAHKLMGIYINNKKRRNATKPGFQRFNQALI